MINQPNQPMNLSSSNMYPVMNLVKMKVSLLFATTCMVRRGVVFVPRHIELQLGQNLQQKQMKTGTDLKKNTSDFCRMSDQLSSLWCHKQ